MKKFVAKCGVVALDGSPGYFYNPNGAELVVYVDNFILISPPHLEKQIRKTSANSLSSRTLRLLLTDYHKISKLKDGTNQMITSTKQ